MNWHRFPLTLALLTGCAGPTTPLGAIWSVVPSKPVRVESSRALAEESPFDGPKIRFIPRRQVLHAIRPVSIIIDDPTGIAEVKENFRVLYNGHDVTQTFLLQARKERSDDRTLVLKIPTLKLAADNPEHDIQVAYRSRTGGATMARYEPPNCRAFEDRDFRSTEDFEPPAELLELIRIVSRNRGFSPAFTAGLVAQESAFVPSQVSWAKAIGLTQVTPLAETELAAMNSHWPRYPGLNSFPFALVKAFILSGEVNERNEWRLNPELSVEGGLAYMRMLSRRWEEPENTERIRQLRSDPVTVHTMLTLASYNSGYSRVLNALLREGPAWLSAPELAEARKYVNRIFSYCDHFSNGGYSDETQT